MEYGKIFNRSVNIVWQHKFLIVLGFLASLASGTFGGGGGGGGGGGNGNANGSGQPGQFQFPDIGGAEAGLAVGVILALLCVVVVLGLALWVISTVSRGGLIAGVNSIESGEKTSFGQSWRAAWQKVWSLLGIAVLPAIPGLILLVIAIMGLGAFGGLFALFGEDFAVPFGTAGIGTGLALVACVVVPIALVLSILRTFAERACMLEGLGVMDSYRRGWNVLRDNLGEAIILFLLQIAIFIVLAILFFLPGIILVLCCLLWPLLMAVQGAITAAISAVWTLAWREWTGAAPLVEKAPVNI